VLGALIVPRVRHNAVGWLLLWTGAAAALAFASQSWPGVPVTAWAGQWTPWLTYGLLPVTLLLFRTVASPAADGGWCSSSPWLASSCQRQAWRSQRSTSHTPC
jgi:hypothetical protein